jgi:CHAT domain-containing protein
VPKLSYTNFEVRLGRPEGAVAAAASYTVEARSPEGEAQGTFRSPFSSDQIAQLLANGPWLDRSVLDESGKELFEALFTADVRSLFATSFSSAKKSGKGLRLRLRVLPSELAVMPWELLRRSDVDISLAQSEWTPVVRHIGLPYEMGPLACDDGLRILLVSSSPTTSDAVDLDEEAASIAVAMEPLGKNVDVFHLRRATKLAFFRELRRRDYHVVHFMLHGDFDPRTKEGYLTLEDEAGAAAPLYAKDLAQLVFDHPQIRVLVLNACETARADASTIFSGLATAVVQAGIPAVVAMQYVITEEAAKHFSKELYLCLAEGYPVDQAVALARSAIVLQRAEGNEWMTPVLYMRATEGVLFNGQPTRTPHMGQEADVRAQVIVDKQTMQARLPAPSEQLAEFALRFVSGRGSQWEIDALSPAGPATVTVKLPDCRKFLKGLEENRHTATTVKAFGSDLFRAIFIGDLKKRYEETLASGPKTFRWSIVSNADALASVPWEYLCDPDRQTFLTLAGGKRPFRRQLVTGAARPLMDVPRPLRILFVTCRPLDMPFLDLEREWSWLQSSLEQIPSDELVVDRLKDPTVSEWAEALSKPYDVLHFAGYDARAFSDFTLDEGIMLLNDDGQKRYVVKDEMINLLQGCDSLQLVVTNTCFTATTLATGLVASGIPSAIGMRGFIIDPVAIRFSKIFYPLLIRSGMRAEIALAETRRLLWLETVSEYPGDWGYPSLVTAAG